MHEERGTRGSVRTDLLDVLKLALWGRGEARADWDVYGELQAHAVQNLAAPVLEKLSLPPELLERWRRRSILQGAYYEAYTDAERTLPLTVPYVILKGSSAARYYPRPELRALGDIDLMTRPGDYEAACRELTENGYTEITGEEMRERARHRGFWRGGIQVEVHVMFASMGDPRKAERFDRLIVSGINPSHVLPDPVNGLTLIEHISQHLQSGLGLRQIIDFMMFADRCLTDENWPAFAGPARETGLETLAVTVMRMCELFLGLREHRCCSGADPRLCAELMDYVLGCGDFGCKLTGPETLAVGRAEKLRHPFDALRELQQRGTENWPRAKNPLLRPFAWIWQGIRFYRDTQGLAEGYAEAQARGRMFAALRMPGAARELVGYQNGEYVKKKKRIP